MPCRDGNQSTVPRRRPFLTVDQIAICAFRSARQTHDDRSPPSISSGISAKLQQPWVRRGVPILRRPSTTASTCFPCNEIRRRLSSVDRRASSVEGRASSVQWNAGSPSVEDSSTRSSLHVAWPDIVWTLCRSRPARTPWRSALGTRLLAVGRWQVNQTWRETIAVGYDVADS